MTRLQTPLIDPLLIELDASTKAPSITNSSSTKASLISGSSSKSTVSTLGMNTPLISGSGEESGAPILEMNQTSLEGNVETDFLDTFQTSTELTAEETDNAQYIHELIIGSSEDVEQDGENREDREEAYFLDALEASERNKDEQSNVDDPIYANADSFITFFSKINVVNNKTLGAFSQVRFEKEVTASVPTGNSRDEPTRFVFFCPNQDKGCGYYSTSKELRNRLSRLCEPSPETSAPTSTAQFYCREVDGCDAGPFNSRSTRNSHELSHRWVRKQCDLGCTDGAWYESYQAFYRHSKRYHDNTWDKTTMCTFPGCPRKTPWAHLRDYETHLKHIHKVKKSDVDSYLPDSAKKANRKRKQPGT
jgi:hypothetical protein